MIASGLRKMLKGEKQSLPLQNRDGIIFTAKMQGAHII